MEYLTFTVLDIVQPAMASVQLALKYVDSDDYFQQLLVFDSALMALQSSRSPLLAMRGARNDQGPEVRPKAAFVLQVVYDLHALIRQFRDLQTKSRNAFNLRARSLRKVKVGVMDLPNELLLKIFDNLKIQLHDPNYFVFDSKDPIADHTAIQNTRLTCRRFRENSSHLLVRHLDITPSMSSLEHLEELIRHPEIWRGERVLRINLRYYCTTIAEDFQSFATMCAQDLQHKVGPFKELLAYDEDRKEWIDKGYSLETLERGVLNARRILSAWRPFTNRVPTQEGASLDAAPPVLQSGYERYREMLRQQQEILRDGYFARTVAAAAAKSHAKVWLSMSDDEPARDDEDHRPRPSLVDSVEASDLDLFADPDLLVQSSLIQPHPWCRVTGDEGETTQSLLYELPLAMHAAKARLAGVAVNVNHPSRWHLGVSQDQLSGLSEVAEGLVAFTFRMDRDNYQMSLPTPEDMSGLNAYLRAIMGPQCVPNLWLSLLPLDWLDVGDRPDLSFPIQPLLHSSSWHNLKAVRLEYLSVGIEDLRKLMGMLESKARLCLKGIRLRDGSWATALDCLRSKADQGSRLVSPGGQDCELLNEQEYRDNYDRLFLSGETKATQYITRVEGVENPYRMSDEGSETSWALSD